MSVSTEFFDNVYIGCFEHPHPRDNGRTIKCRLTPCAINRAAIIYGQPIAFSNDHGVHHKTGLPKKNCPSRITDYSIHPAALADVCTCPDGYLLKKAAVVKRFAPGLANHSTRNGSTFGPELKRTIVYHFRYRRMRIDPGGKITGSKAKKDDRRLIYDPNYQNQSSHSLI